MGKLAILTGGISIILGIFVSLEDLVAGGLLIIIGICLIIAYKKESKILKELGLKDKVFKKSRKRIRK